MFKKDWKELVNDLTLRIGGEAILHTVVEDIYYLLSVLDGGQLQPVVHSIIA